jgi:four helix bundle protein
MMNDENGRPVDEGIGCAGFARSHQSICLANCSSLFIAAKITEAQVLGKQVLRSGTSVGAHYREATRARSPAEFISKIEVGLQELEETVYWLELLIDAQLVDESRLCELLREAGELTAIFVSSAKTAKKSR